MIVEQMQVPVECMEETVASGSEHVFGTSQGHLILDEVVRM